MVNVDVILLDTQKADIRVVRHIRGGYPRHQESKESERQQQDGVKSIYSLENLSSFQQNTRHENDRSRSLIIASSLLGLQILKTVPARAPVLRNDGPERSAQAQSSPAASPTVESIEPILGSYVGAFGDNKITLLITKAGGGSVSGRSIVGGNDRPFDGTIALEGGNYNIEAREPGDHKDDGVFKFRIAEDNLNEVKGTWKANDPKCPEKSYTLERRKFEYRPGVGNWPEASQRPLKTADVENLPKSELEFMRNEIFARHGYCFAKKRTPPTVRERRLVRA